MGVLRAKPYNPKTSSAGRFMGFNRIAGVEGDHETNYMTRVWFGRLRLHIFHRGDNDPDCHDHPWDFWTFPLTPYVEEVAEPIRDTMAEYPVVEKVHIRNDDDGQPVYLDHMTMATPDRPQRFYKRRQIVPAWRWTFRPATHCHRVLGPWDGWMEQGTMRYLPAAFTTPLPNGRPTVGTGPIVTLVWRGKPRRKWGFLKDREGRWCWIGWKDYVFNGGKDAPCKD